uniref:BRCA1/BRCA2-containing complex subunit 3 n=1 Tax=Aotus nancymaae TaxID=37293 RepID=A0A2K5CZ76_AOTNA
SDSKFAYTGTEMRTVAEKIDAVRIVHIHSVIILRRSDKRKDRVEISPEQLSAASTEAEISLLVNRSRPMRVVGWYHSHPHITVWPSHVGKYYGVAMLITGRVLYTCFQSIQAQKSSESLHGPRDFWSASKHIHIEGIKGPVPHGRCFSTIIFIFIFPVEVFTKNLCSQMSAVSGPLLQWLEDRLEQNQQHLRELQQEKEELMQELSSLE